MKRIKEFLLSRDFILFTFIFMGARCLFIEPGIGFALTAVSFASLIGYDKYLAFKKAPDVNAELKAELENVKTHISGLMMRNAAKPAQMQQEIKRFF